MYYLTKSLAEYIVYLLQATQGVRYLFFFIQPYEFVNLKTQLCYLLHYLTSCQLAPSMDVVGLQQIWL